METCKNIMGAEVSILKAIRIRDGTYASKICF
jgi:hypothetical protein